MRTEPIVSIPNGTPPEDIRWAVMLAAAGASRTIRINGARAALASHGVLDMRQRDFCVAVIDGPGDALLAKEFAVAFCAAAGHPGRWSG